LFINDITVGLSTKVDFPKEDDREVSCYQAIVKENWKIRGLEPAISIYITSSR
jgi:hypothetical protein